jgi:preprotein translocase subunit SecA
VSFLDLRCPPKSHPSTWDLANLETDINSEFGTRIRPTEVENLSRQEMEQEIYERLIAKYQEKEQQVGPDNMRDLERMIMLHVIDQQWKDNLLSMDHLKEGIGLRGYGQKDPLVEYKKESYILFQDLMDRIEDETIRFLYFLQVTEGERPPLPFPSEDDYIEPEQPGDEEQQVLAAAHEQRLAAQGTLEDFTRNIQRKKDKEMAALQFAGGDSSGSKTVLKGAKVGRNDPCPCGSGKKYKKCCGTTA